MNYFKDAYFDSGWEIPCAIKLFNVLYVIQVVADAYFENEIANEAQNDSFADFMKNKNAIFDKVEQILIDEATTREIAMDRFLPEFINIKKDGELALIIYDELNKENGLVIVISSNFKVLTTDQYF